MEDALSRLFEHAVLQVVSGERPDFFPLVHVFTCVHKALAAAARADARLPFVIAYHAMAHRRRPASFFFEGIPRAVRLFDGAVPPETAAQLPLQRVAKLTYSDALADRASTRALVMKKSERGLRALAATNTPDDVPAGVPPCAAVFTARMRAVAQALQTTKNVACFAECEHRGCRQRFFRAPGVVAASTDLGGTRRSADAEPSHEYWSLLSGKRSEAAPERRFCSPECCRQFHAELDGALPRLRGKRLDVEPDPGAALSPHSRVVAGLRAAARRNEEFARQLRGVNARRFRACGKTAFRERAETLTRQLNLDFLLLYASSVLAESKSLSAGLVLAGTQVRWRNRPQFVAAAVKRVKAIFDKYQRDPSVVLYNLLLSSQLLQKVKEQSLVVFR